MENSRVPGVGSFSAVLLHHPFVTSWGYHSGDLSTAMFPGRPQDEAVCPLCRAQKGDRVGSTCVHDSYSCSVASKDPKASDGCLPNCLRCQVSLPGKSSGGTEQQEGSPTASLSPTPLPQCTRHRKQVQLLFCEDHREPICLICSLSQEHRGHRVRPIEEAALEYKVGLPARGPSLLSTWSCGGLPPSPNDTRRLVH